MREQPAAEDLSEDPRFNFGLLYDVLEVLEQHGYKPPEPGPDGDKTASNRAHGACLPHLYRLVRAYEGIDVDVLWTRTEVPGG